MTPFEAYTTNSIVSLTARIEKLETESKSRKAIEVAREELKKSLSILVELLKNPTFIKNAGELGYQPDVIGVVGSVVEASGWKFNAPLFKNLYGTDVPETKFYDKQLPTPATLKYFVKSESYTMPDGRERRRYRSTSRREVIESALLDTGWVTGNVVDLLTDAIEKALDKATL